MSAKKSKARVPSKVSNIPQVDEEDDEEYDYGNHDEMDEDYDGGVKSHYENDHSMDVVDPIDLPKMKVIY